MALVFNTKNFTNDLYDEIFNWLKTVIEIEKPEKLYGLSVFLDVNVGILKINGKRYSLDVIDERAAIFGKIIQKWGRFKDDAEIASGKIELIPNDIIFIEAKVYAENRSKKKNRGKIIKNKRRIFKSFSRNK